MFFDISFNAADEMYLGMYNNVQKHQPDIDLVIKRSFENNVIPFFVGTNLKTSLDCLMYARAYNTYSYIGIHPNNATSNKDDLPKVIDLILKLHNDLNHGKNLDFEAETAQSHAFILNKNTPSSTTYDQHKFHSTNTKFFTREVTNNCIAVGECGLDYYRTHATKPDQKCVFKSLLDINQPRYFVHSRSSHRDLLEILSDYKAKVVVHSFDGSLDEANELIKLGYSIGLNGHSTKTNIDVIKEIDINNIMVESDAPYCNIGKTYEGYKHIKTHFRETKKYSETEIYRRRNEPCKTVQVAEVISDVKNMEIEDVKNVLYDNTVKFFDL